MVNMAREASERLHVAIQTGSLSSVKRLIKRVPVVASHRLALNGLTPLAFAAMQGQHDIAAFLLTEGCEERGTSKARTDMDGLNLR